MSEETKEEMLHRWRQLGADHSKAKANRVYLDQYRKSKIALLMRKYAAEGVATAAAQEREALANPEYVELLEGLREAVEIEEKARWEQKICEMQFDAWRTKEASNRQERRSYGA